MNAVKNILSEIRADWQTNNNALPLQGREAAVILFSLILVVAFYYWGRPGFVDRPLASWLTQSMGLGAQSEYLGLMPYAWWAGMSVILRMLLPALFIWWVLRSRLRDHGWRIRSENPHFALYGLFMLGMLPIVYGVSLTDSFQHTYPFYKGAHLGLDHFLLFQLCYGLQFFALEAFFRGFMTFALYRHFGYWCLLIMVIPYCMIHLGKPPAEAFAAIAAGVALGYLALKSGTWVYGAILHWCVAITMDLMAIWQKGGFAS